MSSVVAARNVLGNDTVRAVPFHEQPTVGVTHPADPFIPHGSKREQDQESKNEKLQLPPRVEI